MLVLYFDSYDLAEARKNGGAAARLGYRFDDNPYAFGGSMYAHWMRGFLDVENELYEFELLHPAD